MLLIIWARSTTVPGQKDKGGAKSHPNKQDPQQARGENKGILCMKVQDILKGKGGTVATIQAEASVETLLHRLKLEGVGALVVSPDGEQVAGIVSERDVVRALPDHGAALLQMNASEIMTKQVKTCSPGDKIDDIMAEMTRSRIRHLPVVADGKLSGIISIGDVVKNRLEELESETNVLRDYIVGRS